MILGCLKNDRAAQKELFMRFSGKMLGVCYRYAVDMDEAKDIMQDGFVKVFTQLKSYGNKGSFEGWIRRIMVNTALDHLKKNKRHRFRADLDDAVMPVENNWDDKLENKEVLSLMCKLPADYRTIINLYVIEGYSHAEIAGMLNIAESSSRSRLTRGRFLLKELLNTVNIKL